MVITSHPSLKTTGNALPAGILTLVATPIGNLKDLTFRALEVLQKVDIIVCEDTRVTRKLLDAYQVAPSELWTYHEHNAHTQRPKIIESLLQGKNVALVSDAGTPLISDPGFKLVKQAQEKGLSVTSAPGVSALTTAVSLSGLPTNTFYFGGFLPRKSGERQRLFEELSPLYSTLVFYESARRVSKSLQDMVACFQDREIVIARELTKLYEEIIRGTPEDLIKQLEARSSLKGEVVLLVGPASDKNVSDSHWEEALQEALKEHTLKEAVALISKRNTIPRKRVYEKALELKEKN